MKALELDVEDNDVQVCHDGQIMVKSYRNRTCSIVILSDQMAIVNNDRNGDVDGDDDD